MKSTVFALMFLPAVLAGEWESTTMGMVLSVKFNRADEPIKKMTEEDKRNVIIVELHNRQGESIPALQGMSTNRLIRMAWGYPQPSWMEGTGLKISCVSCDFAFMAVGMTLSVKLNVADEQIKLMSEDDKRNAIIGELFKRQDVSVGTLQAKSTVQLTNDLFWWRDAATPAPTTAPECSIGDLICPGVVSAGCWKSAPCRYADKCTQGISCSCPTRDSDGNQEYEKPVCKSVPTPAPTTAATPAPTTAPCEKKKHYCAVLGDPHVHGFGRGGQVRGPWFELQGEVGKTYVIVKDGLAEVSATLTACGAEGKQKCLGAVTIKVGTESFVIRGDSSVQKNCQATSPFAQSAGKDVVFNTGDVELVRTGAEYNSKRVKQFHNGIENQLQLKTSRGLFDIDVVSTGYRLDIRIQYESCELPNEGACVMADINSPAPIADGVACAT